MVTRSEQVRVVLEVVVNVEQGRAAGAADRVREVVQAAAQRALRESGEDVDGIRSLAPAPSEPVTLPAVRA